MPEINTNIPPTSGRSPRGRCPRIILALEERAMTSGAGHASIVVDKMAGFRMACNRMGVLYTSELITNEHVMAGREKAEDVGKYRFWYLGRQEPIDQEANAEVDTALAPTTTDAADDPDTDEPQDNE